MQHDRGERFEHLFSKFLNSETWTNPNCGFFWMAICTSWVTLISPEYNLEKLNSVFTFVKLDKPMRNSGQILKYAHQSLNHKAKWNNLDYTVESSCFPEGFKPTILKVNGNMKNNLKGYKIVFENALLEMRDFCHFDKKASKTYPCNDAIVVLVPYFFSSSDVDVLAEVANKHGLKSGQYFTNEEDCSFEALTNNNDVLFTEMFIFQGCEAKLLISFEIPVEEEPLRDILEFRIDHIDAPLRCTTKLIVIKTDESKSAPPWELEWSILIRFTLIWSVLITLMPLAQTLTYLLSCFFLVFSFTKFLPFSFLGISLCRDSWMSFSMSLAIANLLPLTSLGSFSIFPLLSFILFLTMFFILFILTYSLFIFLKNLTGGRFLPCSVNSFKNQPPASAFVKLLIWASVIVPSLYLFSFLFHTFFCFNFFQNLFSLNSLFYAAASVFALCFCPYLRVTQGISESQHFNSKL